MLGSKGTRFLTGDTMCCFDCELMPKLQHIRVAGAFFADFHVPGQCTLSVYPSVWGVRGSIQKLWYQVKGYIFLGADFEKVMKFASVLGK